jgi:hypothetical protein
MQSITSRDRDLQRPVGADNEAGSNRVRERPIPAETE